MEKRGHYNKMAYKIKFRNKAFGYNNSQTLVKRFKSKDEAKKWVIKNKSDYIDNVKILKEKK